MRLKNHHSKELNWTELNWTELNWTELNWTELNWTELNCAFKGEESICDVMWWRQIHLLWNPYRDACKIHVKLKASCNY
jgi:hypothetical protein